MSLYYDRDRRNDSGRADYNGDFVPERIEVCWCGDVSCPRHADDPAALEAERVAADTAGVVSAARAILDAFDAADTTVPRRVSAAVMDLSDALARLDRLPM